MTLNFPVLLENDGTWLPLASSVYNFTELTSLVDNDLSTSMVMRDWSAVLVSLGKQLLKIQSLVIYAKGVMVIRVEIGGFLCRQVKKENRKLNKPLKNGFLPPSVRREVQELSELLLSCLFSAGLG